ncbi:GNAT family N-acetyltransferase [Burkholderia cenocepacia]
MSIRQAIAADLPRILELGAQLHAESPRWNRIPFSVERAGLTMAKLLDSPDGTIFVHEADGLVTGGIAGMIQQHWASDAVVAHEVSFFISKDRRGGIAACRLICALDAWARIKGAAWLTVGTSTGVDPELTAQLYERLGFVRCAIGLERVYGN